MQDGNDVVLIKLDRIREIRFGHKALKTLGAITGKEIDSMMKMDGLDLEAVEKILYCGLLSDARAHGEELRLEDMEDLLDYANPWNELIEKMQLAFERAFGTTHAGESNPGNGQAKLNRQQRRATGKKA
ncbi:hypothetical protein [Paenibacillus sp.]|uniref:hypothetical protein n=1 Tax=Paenibacillus sp. TaxID=58172 RepID=UPI002D544FAD|nr:hypothetical protein [Paenibacillus sp.]HZG83831.1 hypothetical protein [Paenibacillus sp.]